MNFINTKMIVCAALSLATILFTSFFWTYPLLLTMLLGATSLLMILNERDQVAWYVYFLGFVFGPLSEAFSLLKEV